MNSSLLFALCVSAVIFLPAPILAEQLRWWKGNTHTHTINTDGDSSPDTVARWYKEHGWNFVVISDHDMLTPVEGLNALMAAPRRFLVLAGVEVTDRAEGLPVHLIGVGVREAVLPRGGATKVEALQADAQAIRTAGGIPHINHPNYEWALTAQDLTTATEAKHFELINGHPAVNNFGGGGSPSTEEMWDLVLSTGRLLYGVGTDDAHHFKEGFLRERKNPGRAWVMVRAPKLSQKALITALETGDFYASTSVTLRSYEVTDHEIRIELPENADRAVTRYRTYFIGKDGAVLKRDDSPSPAYPFQGNELYVRARIEASNGTRAWTQPLFLKK